MSTPKSNSNYHDALESYKQFLRKKIERHEYLLNQIDSRSTNYEMIYLDILQMIKDNEDEMIEEDDNERADWIATLTIQQSVKNGDIDWVIERLGIENSDGSFVICFERVDEDTYNKIRKRIPHYFSSRKIKEIKDDAWERWGCSIYIAFEE